MPPASVRVSVPATVWLMLIGAVVLLVLPTRDLSGQSAAPNVSDSLELVAEAKEVQARYERYRE